MRAFATVGVVAALTACGAPEVIDAGPVDEAGPWEAVGDVYCTRFSTDVCEDDARCRRVEESRVVVVDGGCLSERTPLCIERSAEATSEYPSHVVAPDGSIWWMSFGRVPQGWRALTDPSCLEEPCAF